MLGNYWRLRLLWTDADQSLVYANNARVTAKTTVWKLVSGVRTKEEIDDNFGFTSGTIVDDGQVETPSKDNETTNKYWGGKGSCTIIASEASTDGAAYLYLEESPDDTIWPSDAVNQFVIGDDMTLLGSAFFVAAAQDDSKVIEYSFGSQ